MRSLLSLSALFLLIFTPLEAQNSVALLNTDDPWSTALQRDSELMDEAFGPGNWDNYQYGTVDLHEVLSEKRIIWMESNFFDRGVLQEFYSLHRTTLQRWVSEGGILFMNFDPDNLQAPYPLGFDDLQISPVDYDAAFEAADLSHALFSGSYQPVGTNWSGTNAFEINGPDLDPILVRSADRLQVVLGEKKWGAGLVILGALSHIGFQSPQPEVTNLRLNLLEYLEQFRPPVLDAGVNSFTPTGPLCAGPGTISALVSNYGRSFINSGTVEWTLNGVPQPPVPFEGALDTLGSGQNTAQIDLLAKDFQVGDTDTIKAWIGSINGLLDTINQNDTLQQVFFARLSGNFTIGGNEPDYQRSTDAVADLVLYGVCGDVVYDIRPGVYEEQIVIPEITGAGPNSNITFRSESGDSTDVVLTYHTDAADPFIIKFSGADWIRLEGLTLDATILVGVKTIELEDGSTNNIFSHNQFLGSTASTYSYGIYANSSLNNNNRLLYNRFDGHGRGIYFSGQTFSPSSDLLEITGNIFSRQIFGSIYLSNPRAFTIRGNKINDDPSISTDYFEGIVIDRGYNSGTISGNSIKLSKGAYGLQLRNINCNPDTPLSVDNNFVYLSGNDDRGAGIHVAFGSEQVYNYNTIHVDRKGEYNRCIQLEYGKGQQLFNNLFANTSGGEAIFYRGTLSASDYNCLFSSGSSLFNYNNYAVQNLQDWRELIQLDMESISVDPKFIFPDSFLVAESELDGNAMPLANVPTDISGDPRDAQSPDIGCREFTPPPHDAGMVEHIAPVSPFGAGMQTVQFSIKNFGSAPLQSAIIHWEVNGVSLPSVDWTGNLATNERDTVSLGELNFTDESTVEITAWTEAPNQMSDAYALNDTAKVKDLLAGLVGEYTIGGQEPDFLDFSAAVDALTKGGILGPVVFQVRNGIYQEKVVIPEIKGTSQAQQIIFQSEQGDSTAVVLTYTDNDYVLKMDGADWLTFRQLTFRSTNPNGSNIFLLENDAQHNHFINNHLSANVSNFGKSNINISSIGKNLPAYILNNYFENNYYGVIVSKPPLDMSDDDLEVIGNTFFDQAKYGININRLTSPAIRENLFLDDPSSEESFIGIYMRSCAGDFELAGNRVISPKSGMGIYLVNCTGNSDQRARIVNNFVYLGEDNPTTPKHGIYSDLSDYQDFLFNTVHIDHRNSKSTAINIYGLKNNRFYNNNFVNTGGGYAISLGSNASLELNYNNLYSPGPFLCDLQGDDISDLVTWQLATGQDAMSVSVDPYFSLAGNYKISNALLNEAGTPISDITTDITGTSRGGSPDIGCVEFEPLSVDIGISRIVLPHEPFAAGSQPIRVVVQNFGSNTVTNAQVQWEVDGIRQNPLEWTGNLASKQADTVLVGTINFAVKQAYTITAWTEQPNLSEDLIPQNDTTILVEVYAGLNGIYTIGGSVPDFSSFTEASELLHKVGVAGPVVFEVRDGIYEESVDLKAIPGISSERPLTFQSASGDSSRVILQYQTSREIPYVLRLTDMAYTHFHQITFEAMGNNYADVIVLERNNQHIRFTNNQLIARSDEAQDYCFRAGFDNQSSHLELKDNLIKGNHYGIFVRTYIDQTHFRGLIVEGNRLLDQSGYGALLTFLDSPIIRNNRIIGKRNIVTIGGLSVWQVINGMLLESNQVDLYDARRGIEINTVNGDAEHFNLIINNMVIIGGSQSEKTAGLFLNRTSFVKVAHNTININNTKLPNYALGTYDVSEVNLYNNIFSNLGGGHVYFYTGGLSNGQLDFNNLYTTGTDFAYWGWVNYIDLEDWQSSQGQDLHSISNDPEYVNDTLDLHINNNQLLNNRGKPLPYVTTDIDGESRNPSTPDMGADEFTFVPTYDLSVLAILSPDTSCGFTAGEVIQILIHNGSDVPVNNFPVGYRINGGQAVLEQITDLEIPVNGDAVYVFESTADLYSLQEFTLEAFTLFPEDVQPENDTLKFKSSLIDSQVQCECDGTSLYFPNTTLIKNYYNAEYEIVSSNPVEPDMDITFRAGEYILLKPGFHVKPGGRFHALIDGCRDYANFSDPPLSNVRSNMEEKADNILLTATPNPFGKNSIVSFNMPHDGRVWLSLINIHGQQMANLINGVFLDAGSHQLNLEGSNYPAGAYFVSLVINGERINKKVILIK